MHVYQAYAFATIIRPIFSIEEISDECRQKIASNNGRRVCKYIKESKKTLHYIPKTMYATYSSLFQYVLHILEITRIRILTHVHTWMHIRIFTYTLQVDSIS